MGTKRLAELIARLDEENPRIHSVDTDIIGLAIRLLHHGWCKYPTYNEKLGKVVGGHGRILACEWLAQQPNAWFDEQWESWEKAHGSQYFVDELPEVRKRYRSGYWTSIPVQIVSLSKKQHRTALLTLNHRTGQDNDNAIAKMLAKLSPIDSADAGFNETEKNEFLARVALPSLPTDNLYDQISEDLGRKLSLPMADDDPVPVTDDDSEPVTSFDPDDFDPVDDENEIVVPQGGLNYNADPDEPCPSLYPLSIVLKGEDLEAFERAKAEANINTDKIFLLRYHPAFAN